MTLSYTVLTGAQSVDGSIKQWVNNTTIPSATILQMAEQWIYREARLRVRQMLAVEEAGVMSTAQASVDLPERYLSHAEVQYTGTYKDDQGINQRDIEDVEVAIAYGANGTRVAGKPRMFWASDAEMYFEVLPLAAYTYRQVYFAEPAPLAASSNETNLLTAQHPRLLLAACVAMAWEFLREWDEARTWLGIAGDSIMRANADFDVERMRGAPIDIYPQ